jgi:putative membrane protein
MLMRWVVAALHRLALAIGFGAIWVRSRTFDGPLDPNALKRLFAADNLWGAAAILWIATGLTRAFGGLEKGSAYYLHNWLFRARRRVSRGETVDTRHAMRFARVGYAEAALLVLMVFAATGMARGVGQ